MRADGASPYIDDIRAQASALADFLGHGAAASCKNMLRQTAEFDRIVLTGMGSSLAGMYPGYLRMARAGLPVWHVDAAELLGYSSGLLTDRTLLWITSQSGESAEVLAILNSLPRRRPAIFGVTNDSNSTLADVADAVQPLYSGVEDAVATRSYINTLAATAVSVSALTEQEIDPELFEAPSRIEEYLIDWDAHLDDLDRAVKEPTMFILGRGSSLASARTAALIIKEASRQPAEGMSPGQFRHGPLEMASSDTSILLFAGSAEERILNVKLRQKLETVGAKCVWIEPGGESRERAVRSPDLSSPQTRQIGEILPLQLLTIVLGHRLGIEPGVFRQIEKITRQL